MHVKSFYQLSVDSGCHTSHYVRHTSTSPSCATLHSHCKTNNLSCELEDVLLIIANAQFNFLCIFLLALWSTKRTAPNEWIIRRRKGDDETTTFPFQTHFKFLYSFNQLPKQPHWRRLAKTTSRYANKSRHLRTAGTSTSMIMKPSSVSSMAFSMNV